MEIILALIAFAIVGILAGIIAGLLGLSGGVIAVPCLALIFHFMDFPQVHLMHIAIGTSLAAMIINATASTLSHHRRGGVVWDVVIAMLPGLFLGCLLGTFVASFLSSIILQIVFGLFIAALGTYVLLKKSKKHDDGIKKINRTLYTWIGLGVGFISSMLGVGGGIFMVPLLISHHYAEKKAIGTSAAIGLLVTILAAIGYLYYGRGMVDAPYMFGYIYLPAFLVMGLMTIFFAPLGAKLAHQMDPKKLRRIFAATLILIGIAMIFN